MNSLYSSLVEKVLAKINTSKPLPEVKEFLPKTGFSHPFITIAREPGSGGHPIGRIVAERLKFQFVDEELIEEISKSTKRRKEIIQAVDEKGRTAIQDLVQGVVNPDYVSDLTYVSELTKVILTYAYNGNVVILGRGSNIITPFAQGLHVRITAPYSVRLQRAVDYEGHSLTKAKEVLSKYQKDRKDFVKQYLRKDIEDADTYDLTLNTTYFTVEQSVDMILAAFHSKFSTMSKLKNLLRRS